MNLRRSGPGWLLLVTLIVGCGDDVAPMDASLTCATDAECDDSRFCNGAELCDPGSARADERGCVPSTSPCGTSETCDDAMGRCIEACDDADGDGAADIACGGSDCDDLDPGRYPGNTEICDQNGVDEDCDATTPGDKDQDGDGAIDAICCNGDDCGSDCDDTKASVLDGATEACNGLDDDCDGNVDEGVAMAGYADADFDLHGDPDAPMMACAGTPGFSTLDDDCNDANPAVHGAQVELCDGIDNDCDTNVDEESTEATWYLDRDGDGFGDPRATRESCDILEGYSLLPSDCDDDDPDVNPAAAELCNGIDDDCNGVADFRLGVNDFEDDDGDGIVDPGCALDGVLADCDDRDRERYPGALESCDGRDNDCDDAVDEDCGGSLTCPRGTDPTTAPDCDPILCAMDERVLAHECVSCLDGFTNDAGDDASDADTQCDDLDECSAETDDCEEDCINTFGSFRCDCSSPALVLAPDGRSCVAEQIFDMTGSPQQFVVPEGVTSLDVELHGGRGGATQSVGSPAGGAGAITTGTLTVTPGQTIHVYVGGAANFSTPGYNGGGQSGTAGTGGTRAGCGGGATDIRVGGTTLSDRIMVAGGGGGAGHSFSGGGAGGGATGANGGTAGSRAIDGEGGQGGSQIAGGAAGTKVAIGSPGTEGVGGDSAAAGRHPGGAGGGGYYGGGAGGGTNEAAIAGGGGGGSSYADPSVASPVLMRGGNTGNGQAIFRWTP